MKEFVRTVLDYPVKGVQFRDITTLLQNSSHFKQVIDEMTEPWIGEKIDAILSIESRGFIMAGAIAYNLNTAFIPLRKHDKLPGETFKVNYTLEYGSTEMHIHKDALDGHVDLLIIDDLLATGGTALAAIDWAGFIINLPELGGSKKLDDLNIKTNFLMEFDGS